MWNIAARVSGEGTEQDHFRELAEHIRAILWVALPDGSRTLYCSPAYETLFGRPVAELYADPGSWLDGVHPDDRPRVQGLWRRRTAGYDAEYRVVRPDETVIHVHDRAEPIRDASGAVVRLVGVTTDVTTVRRLEEQLTHAQKMESLGRLAGGVAHEVNNLLTVLLAHARMARVEPDRAEQHLADIEEAARRGGELTARLLGLTSAAPIRAAVLDLGALVRQEEPALGAVRGACSVVLESQPGTHPVRADGSQLRRLLQDLVANAAEAMPGGGRIVVEVRAARYEPDDLDRPPQVESGEHVVLRVRDAGVGIPDRDRSRVFEPFFSTKRDAAGMGLTTAYGIVARAGGHIGLESVPGAGTAVTCTFPRAREAVPAPPPGPAAAGDAAGATVLVVEDEPMVRMIVTGALRDLGFHVLEAADGIDALAVADTGPPPALLVTDVVMPRMGGRELAARLRVRMPGLRVLFVSGYTDGALGDAEDRDTAFLPKPFVSAELAAAVRDLLDPDPAPAA